MGKKKGRKARSSAVKLPKRKCCESKPQCGRCPLRMLKEGSLPEGYTVRKRELVRLDGTKVTKKKAKKLAKAA